MAHKNARRPAEKGIVVLDFGSQYTLLIARRLREAGVYSEVIDGMSKAPPEGLQAAGYILSGGPDSVTDDQGRKLPEWVVQSDVPILGICYGMQLLISHHGGDIRSGVEREYGRATLHLEADMAAPGGKVFYDQPAEQVIWMSHGDDMSRLPEGFRVVGTTDGGVAAAVVHESRPWVGLQFHPEVQHTEYGGQILRQFCRDLCRIEFNWQPAHIVSRLSEEIRSEVGDGRVLVAVSGGVDSSVAATLMARALGADRVHAVFVDHGLLRKAEASWVVDNLRFLGLSKIHLLERQDLFLGRLEGVREPELKRKIIGETFIEEFEAHAREREETFTHFGQGTLYPDVIESAGHGAGAKVIKSHHNVGGLPDKLELKLIEPFRYLFKDEVRAIGEEMGIAHDLLWRHPFPGPGLAVRILGDINPDNVAMLQEADHIFISLLREHDLYTKAWQAFAVLLPVKSVGVMGDNRTYEQTVALRAVTASDGMTAGVADLPMSFLTEVSDRIVRQVPGINRVVYDVTTKPPATIEWE